MTRILIRCELQSITHVYLFVACMSCITIIHSRKVSLS